MMRMIREGRIRGPANTINMIALCLICAAASFASAATIRATASPPAAQATISINADVGQTAFVQTGSVSNCDRAPAVEFTFFARDVGNVAPVNNAIQANIGQTNSSSPPACSARAHTIGYLEYALARATTTADCPAPVNVIMSNENATFTAMCIGGEVDLQKKSTSAVHRRVLPGTIRAG